MTDIYLGRWTSVNRDMPSGVAASKAEPPSRFSELLAEVFLRDIESIRDTAAAASEEECKEDASLPKGLVTPQAVDEHDLPPSNACDASRPDGQSDVARDKSWLMSFIGLASYLLVKLSSEGLVSA